MCLLFDNATLILDNLMEGCFMKTFDNIFILLTFDFIKSIIEQHEFSSSCLNKKRFSLVRDLEAKQRDKLTKKSTVKKRTHWLSANWSCYTFQFTKDLLGFCTT